jgi:hypothetical protein
LLKWEQRRLVIAVFLVLLAISGVHAQTSSQNSSQASTGEANTEHPASAVPTVFAANVVRDQKQIWTAPFKARIEDLNWLVPVAGVTAGLINADAELSSRIDTTGTLARHANTISNGGLALSVGGAGGLYLLGKLRSDDHERETGIVGVEAATDGLIVTEALKMVTLRERPTDGNGRGLFYENGSVLNSSFPSAHSTIAWAVASAVSHEYPGLFTKGFTYSAATLVSLARVYGKDHFPSDVFVGAVAGWLIGREVYSSHHDLDLNAGGGWGTFHRDKALPEDAVRSTPFSPYVPMDSWVYAAFDRLAALGATQTGFASQRPWTRQECARLIEEAQNSVDETSGDEPSRLLAALEREFTTELRGSDREYVGIDSVYARTLSTAGPALTDDYHFGRTVVNDFGRPYERGTNAVAGVSGSGSVGAFGFYVRGEYEHAPSAPAVPQAVQDAIQVADEKVPAPVLATPELNQFRLLDGYVSLNIRGWQASFGKQNLWLGPTQDPMLWSTNAEPVYMFRVDQTVPKKLPSLLRYLGPYRIEFWEARLAGHHFVNTQSSLGDVVTLGRSLSRQPMVNGFKVNFKPTPNFDFGVGATGLWGGPDFPITVGSFRHAALSTGNAVGRGNDPGDRRSSFDFSYRIPKLRDLLTLYEDSIVEDEISPIGYPRRAAHDAGIYLSRLPKLPHMDFRAEGAYTNLPGLFEPPGGGFFYWNVRYLDGYTVKGNIIGDATVGRQGIALRAETTYWAAADKTLRLGYRSNIADDMFVQGGNFRDIYARSDWTLKTDFLLSTFLQYEYWNFPLLTEGVKQNNFTAAFEITWQPHWRVRHGS